MSPFNQELNDAYPYATQKLDLFRAAFEEVKHLEGDFAEFGVYNGHGVRALASLDRARDAYAFDTFEGMPAEDYNGVEDSSDPVGKWKPHAQPEALFRGESNIRVYKGRFAETLPTVPAETRFILCHLDCDWYNSYTQVLTWLEAHLAPGAILFLDDYPNCAGCKRAVDEWVERMGAAITYDGQQRITWHGMY